MTGAYKHREEYPEHWRQTELPMPVDLEPPYNGLFYCRIREGMYRWPEYINFYKQKRL